MVVDLVPLVILVVVVGGMVEVILHSGPLKATEVREGTDIQALVVMADVEEAILMEEGVMDWEDEGNQVVQVVQMLQMVPEGHEILMVMGVWLTTYVIMIYHRGWGCFSTSRRVSDLRSYHFYQTYMKVNLDLS